MKKSPSKNKISKSGLSSTHKALGFACVFGLLGAILLFKSFADTTVGMLEAENMVLSSGTAQVISDSTASNGQALALTSNVTANGTITLSDKATDMTIRARGTQCHGAPQVSVSIDGKQSILASVSSTSWTNYKTNLALAVGSHTVSATMTNPYSKGHCNRTLYLDNVTATNSTPTTTTTDTQPPTVSLTSPSSGSTVSGSVAVAASASDNTAVSKVEFYVDNTLASTVTASPYNYAWDTTTTANASHTLSAKAYDAAGNVGTAAAVTVTVNNTTPVSTTGTPPSGLAMPTGDLASSGHTWHQIATEDFTKDAALGSWADDCSPDTILYTGATGTPWRAYPKCYTDTNQKRAYRSDQVLSVHDGSLDFWLHTVDGHPAGANPSPVLPNGTQYQTYGRYDARFKLSSSSLSDYYSAWLLWPQDDSKWQCAESDFPETQLSASGANAFAHYGCTGAQDYFNKSFDKTQWHTYTQEWMPGKRNYYIDGTLIGSSTNQVYSGIERWQLQTETNTNCESTNSCTEDGHLLVDWAVVYAY